MFLSAYYLQMAKWYKWFQWKTWFHLLLITGLWPIFFKQVRYIVDRRYCVERYWHQGGICAALCGIALRFVLYGYGQAHGLDALMQSQLFLGVFNRGHRMDSQIFVCMAFFVLYAAYLNYRVHFTRVDDPIWQLIYDLTVRNLQQFFDARRMIISRPSFPNSRHYSTHIQLMIQYFQSRFAEKVSGPETSKYGRQLRIFRSTVRDFWCGNGKFRSNLWYFEKISYMIRTRVLLLMFGLEGITTIVFVINLILCLVVLFYYFKLMLPLYGWLWIVLIELDLVTLLFQQMVITKLILLVFDVLSVVFFVYLLHFDHLKYVLTRSLVGLKMGVLSRTHLIQATTYFNTEHSQIVHYVMITNRQFWSHLMIWFIFTNIPINVYFLNFAVYRLRSIEGNAWLLLLILAMQSLAVVFIFYPTAYLSNRIHSFSGYFTPIQIELKGTAMLGVKWKHLSHYEMVHNRYHRIAFTVGPLGELTTRTMAEFMFAYCTMLSFVHRLIN